MVAATGKYVVWVTILDSEGQKEIASSLRDEDNYVIGATEATPNRYRDAIGKASSSEIEGKCYQYKITNVNCRYLENGHYLVDVTGKSVS